MVSYGKFNSDLSNAKLLFFIQDSAHVRPQAARVEGNKFLNISAVVVEGTTNPFHIEWPTYIVLCLRAHTQHGICAAIGTDFMLPGFGNFTRIHMTEPQDGHVYM